MNKVILIGRLAADPEIRFTQSNKCVASYRLAVDRAFKAEGQPDADFIGCVAWGKNGEFCQKYLHKGMKIAVEGRIQTRNRQHRPLLAASMICRTTKMNFRFKKYSITTSVLAIFDTKD